MYISNAIVINKPTDYEIQCDWTDLETTGSGLSDSKNGTSMRQQALYTFGQHTLSRHTPLDTPLCITFAVE